MKLQYQCSSLVFIFCTVPDCFCFLKSCGPPILIYPNSWSNQIYKKNVGPWKNVKTLDFMTNIFTDIYPVECFQYPIFSDFFLVRILSFCTQHYFQVILKFASHCIFIVDCDHCQFPQSAVFEWVLREASREQ